MNPLFIATLTPQLKEIHIKDDEIILALKSIRINLQWYIGDYDASLFKILKGTECSSGFMKLIEDLLKDEKDEKYEVIDKDFIQKHYDLGLDLKQLVNAIALDQKHDFNDTSNKRCDLSGYVNFIADSLSNMNDKIGKIIMDPSNGVKALKGDDELRPEKYSIDMGPQSQYAKSIRKAIDSLDNNQPNGGQINTISQIIDAAGCDTSCESDTVSNSIDIGLQFYIYNIGYLFFQGFFKSFTDNYRLNDSSPPCKYRVLFGNGPEPPRGNNGNTLTPFTPLQQTYPDIGCVQKQYSTSKKLTNLKDNIYLFVYKDDTMIASNKINVGSIGFSVKNICGFIKGGGINGLFTTDFITKIKDSITQSCSPSMVLSCIHRFFVSLPMSIKCYGDSGQMILSLVMSCSDKLCSGKYANKYILITCDTFFFQLLHLFKCPFILGTRSTPCYLYNESSKFNNKKAIKVYSDTDGNIKIATNSDEAKYEGLPDGMRDKLLVYTPISEKQCTYYFQVMNNLTTAVRNNNRVAIDTICNKYVIVPYGTDTNPKKQSYCLVERGHFVDSNIKTIGKDETITRFHIIVDDIDSTLVYSGTGDGINASKDVFDESIQTFTRVTKLKTFIETINGKLKYYDDITYTPPKKGSSDKKDGILFSRQFSDFSSKFSSKTRLKAPGRGNHLDTLVTSLVYDDSKLLSLLKDERYVKNFKQILLDLNSVFKMNDWYKEFIKRVNSNAMGLQPCGLTKDAFKECFDMCDCYVLELDAVNKHLETIYKILVEKQIKQSVKDELCDDAVKLINYSTKIESFSKSSTDQLNKVIHTTITTIDDLLPLFERLKEIQNNEIQKKEIQKKGSKPGFLEMLNKERHELFGKSISKCIDDYIYFADFIKNVKEKIRKHNAVIELSSPSFLMSYNFISLFKKLLPQRVTLDDNALQDYKSATNILLVSLKKKLESNERGAIIEAMDKEALLNSVIKLFQHQRQTKKQKTTKMWGILKGNLKDVVIKLSNISIDVKKEDDKTNITGSDLDVLEKLFEKFTIDDKAKIKEEGDNSLLEAKGKNNELGDKIFIDDVYDCDVLKDCEKICDDVCDLPSSGSLSKKRRLNGGCCNSIGGEPKTYKKTAIKKDILGRERIIYKVSGSRKEYIKYKGDYMYVKDYIMSKATSKRAPSPTSKPKAPHKAQPKPKAK